MDAVKFLQERERMCTAHHNCDGCTINGVGCGEVRNIDAKRLVDAVEEWSAAHPRKTRQSVFLEQWPNVVLDEHDVIAICPTTLSAAHRDRIKDCANPARRCADCRREFWMQEVE